MFLSESFIQNNVFIFCLCFTKRAKEMCFFPPIVATLEMCQKIVFFIVQSEICFIQMVRRVFEVSETDFRTAVKCYWTARFLQQLGGRKHLVNKAWCTEEELSNMLSVWRTNRQTFMIINCSSFIKPICQTFAGSSFLKRWIFPIVCR